MTWLFLLLCWTSAEDCDVVWDSFVPAQGQAWQEHVGWDRNVSCCTWSGITCKNGVVDSVVLSSMELVGEIPSSLTQLSSLRTLSLDANKLIGHVPNLSALSNLTRLTLADNQLQGQLPDSLGELTLLRRFRAFNNKLSGPLPASLSKLQALTQLLIYNNDFTGSLPALGSLTDLQILRVDDNWLTGEIPSLSGLSALTIFDAHANLFNGTFPQSLCALTQMTILRLEDNRLRGGGIPSCLGQFSNLTVLDLSGNRLGGMIPIELANSTSLETLKLGGMHLHGKIPPALSNLEGLFSLVLTDNGLGGTIPELGALTKLAILDLGDNFLTGSIPSSFSDMTSLDMLALSANQLRGDIPSLAKLTRLTNLRLDHNNFTGKLPEWIAELTELRSLALLENRFTGSVPASWGALVKLRQLLLHDNALDGVFPPCIEQMVQLDMIRLDKNRFTGDFQVNLSALTTLRYLRINDNYLQGEIGDSILQLPHLEYINVAQNYLVGDLPSLLLRLSPSVRCLDVSDNSFSGSGDWDLLAGNLIVFNFSFNLLESVRLTEASLASPSLIDLRETWLICPFPSFAATTSVSSSGPLPCSPDLSLLTIELMIVLAVGLAFLVWSFIMAYRKGRGCVTFVKEFFLALNPSTVVTVRVTLRLITIALLPFFFAAAFRNLEYTPPTCSEVDNGFIFGYMLSWPLSCYAFGQPFYTPLPSERNWTFAEYMDEVVNTGPCYSNTTLYVQENIEDFHNLCANLRGCRPVVASPSGWLTCEQAPEAPLAIFGTREVVGLVLWLLLAVICLKELLKIVCLLLSRFVERRPVMRDFANTSFLMPFILYGSPVRENFNYQPTRWELLMRFVVDSLGEALPVLLLGVYFRLNLLHTNLGALATATLPLSLVSVTFSLCRLCLPRPKENSDLMELTEGFLNS